MSLLNSLITSITIAPPKLIVYGQPGIGKTSLAAQADAILLDCEGGAGSIDKALLKAHPAFRRTPYLPSWKAIRQWLSGLTREDLGGAPVVAIDTIDWMVRRIVEYVVIDLDKKSPDDVTNTIGTAHGGYYKARDIVQNIVSRELFLHLNAITARGVAVLLLAHAANAKMTTPEGYDLRLAAPDLPDWIAPLFVEWADAVLYAHHADGKARVLQTTGSNVVLAKNRYSLPAKLPLDWSVLMNAIAKERK